MSDSDQDQYWRRLLIRSPYDTIEQLRDAIDRPDWRRVEAARAITERQRGLAAREVSDSFGAVAQRSHRQVNVKLSQPDYEMLKALAVERDLPPSTLARSLLRSSLVAEATSEP